MSELGHIREGMAAALNTHLGEGVQVSAWRLTSHQTPYVEVFPGAVDYHQAMGNGHANWPMKVRAYVALNNDIAAQQDMDDFQAVTGPRSVKQALEADPTLGGACEDLIVHGTEEPQEYVKDGAPLLGVDWNVEVWA